MAEPKEKAFRIFMEGPKGANRTIELTAKDKAAATRKAERQAEDIAEEHGGDPYTVVSVEAV